MTNFAAPQTNLGLIQEERTFTNPHIRFRRINGRIVPIVNKKRVGQEVNLAGDKAMKVGATLAAAGLATKVIEKKGQAMAASFKKEFPKFTSRSTSLFKALKGAPQPSVKATGSIARVGGKIVAKGFKHHGKIGLGLIGIGVLLKTYGSDLEVDSQFGKDFFFTKDEVNP